MDDDKDNLSGPLGIRIWVIGSALGAVGAWYAWTQLPPILWISLCAFFVISGFASPDGTSTPTQPTVKGRFIGAGCGFVIFGMLFGFACIVGQYLGPFEYNPIYRI